MGFSWNPNTKWAEVPQSSISTHPFFWCSLFFKNISTARLEPTNGKQCCLRPLSFKISLKDRSFHISLNSLGLYLSSECLLNLYIPPCLGKNFKFMVFAFLEKTLNLGIFTHAPVHHSELQAEVFENLFLQRKGCRKLWFALSKFNQKIWRWLYLCLLKKEGG